MEINKLIDEIISDLTLYRDIAHCNYRETPPGDDSAEKKYYLLGRATGQLILAKELKRVLRGEEFRFEVIQ